MAEIRNFSDNEYKKIEWVRQEQASEKKIFERKSKNRLTERGNLRRSSSRITLKARSSGGRALP
jgi:hypothetical protein